MKRAVHLHVEGVPNPNAMRFVLENGILLQEPYEFTSFSETEFSPLARKLLLLRYVQRVLINRNYITIVKKIESPAEWHEILPEIRMLIQQHLESNEPILFVGKDKIKHSESENPVMEIIQKVLDTHIRPAAQEDGGDILIDSFENGKLELNMHGACHKCPYATNTIKQGVEPLLNQLVPEVKEVIWK